MTITQSTILKLKFGDFTTTYHKNKTGEAVAFSLGDIKNTIPIVRIHSACLFGEAFLSKHCDCKDQLHQTFELIKKHGCGIVVYGFQEGRGIGLEQKIKAMEIQRINDCDTVEAFKQLGLKPDLREYSVLTAALKDLNINKEIILVTNNPEKEKAIKKAGYKIKELVKIEVKLNKYIENERLTKKNKLGYYID
jgi:3,4-dihydroxy 2-butanone 4-phosphate synthase / GTP cyclohydrolase II